MDASHIPTKQLMQKSKTQGGYSGNVSPSIILEEPMTIEPEVQVQKTFQKLQKKNMSRVELAAINAKYKETLRRVLKSKPTPVMQQLDKEIEELEQKVKNAPEPMMDDDFLYDTEKKNIKKRKNEALAKRNTKKLHRLEQQELILEQERINNQRLQELQKLRLAAELERIQLLEEQ